MLRNRLEGRDRIPLCPETRVKTLVINLTRVINANSCRIVTQVLLKGGLHVRKVIALDDLEHMEASLVPEGRDVYELKCVRIPRDIGLRGESIHITPLLARRGVMVEHILDIFLDVLVEEYRGDICTIVGTLGGDLLVLVVHTVDLLRELRRHLFIKCPKT